jgi:hypothetical protein
VFYFYRRLHSDPTTGRGTVKYAFCPIHDFFRPGQKSVRDTDRVHSLYTRAYTSCNPQGRRLDRNKIAWRKCKIMLQSAVWPLACVASALRHTLLYGARTRKVCGKPVFRQFLEQLGLGIGEGVPPHSYYLFSLFEETRKELAACLERSSAQGGLLVQPRLHNHDDLEGLSTGGLCTSRLVTVRTPAGKPELVAAIQRIPVGDSVVDNFAAGGIACPVETSTGVLCGPAVSWSPLSAGHDLHPDTAQKIDGVQLPDWGQAMRICIQAHTAFNSCPAIGWDVAFTMDGPVLVEGNLPFGIELTQFVSGTPLLATRFLEAHIKFMEQCR